jgi:hypothetical protein
VSKNKIHLVASAAAVLWIIATPVLADDPRWFAFYRALTNEFIVNTNGITTPADMIRMVDEKWIDSAAGNQATQPYKRLRVPPYPWGGYEVETNLKMFRMRPDEAVLYLGPTPPPCDYFSYTPPSCFSGSLTPSQRKVTGCSLRSGTR